MSLKGCRILIVDDEEDLLDMVAEAFEEEGCNVSTANNGEDAINIFLEKVKRGKKLKKKNIKLMIEFFITI